MSKAKVIISTNRPKIDAATISRLVNEIMKNRMKEKENKMNKNTGNKNEYKEYKEWQIRLAIEYSAGYFPFPLINFCFLGSEKGAVRFKVSEKIFRVSLCGSVEEKQGIALVGTNEAKRIEGILRNYLEDYFPEEKSENFVTNATNASLSMDEMKIIIEDFMDRKVDFYYPRVGASLQDVAIDMAAKAKSLECCVICVFNQYPIYVYPIDHADDVLSRYYRARADRRRTEKSE